MYRQLVGALLQCRTQTAIWEISEIWAAAVRVYGDVVADFEVCESLLLLLLLLLLLFYRCPRRNFGRVFLMLKYTDITQNTYIQS